MSQSLRILISIPGKSTHDDIRVYMFEGTVKWFKVSLNDKNTYKNLSRVAWTLTTHKDLFWIDPEDLPIEHAARWLDHRKRLPKSGDRRSNRQIREELAEARLAFLHLNNQLFRQLVCFGRFRQSEHLWRSIGWKVAAKKIELTCLSIEAFGDEIKHLEQELGLILSHRHRHDITEMAIVARAAYLGWTSEQRDREIREKRAAVVRDKKRYREGCWPATSPRPIVMPEELIKPDLLG